MTHTGISPPANPLEQAAGSHSLARRCSPDAFGR
jgi:hypothetical protein